jgi:hypothetical protein
MTAITALNRTGEVALRVRIEELRTAAIQMAITQAKARAAATAELEQKHRAGRRR